MLEIGIAQAQAQLTKILDKKVVIVDKKSGKKRAVMIPWEEYKRLLRQKKNPQKRFGDFAGILNKEFKTDDPRYNRIVK